MDSKFINEKLQELVEEELYKSITIQKQILKGAQIHITTLSRFQPHLKFYNGEDGFDIAVAGHLSPREGPCQVGTFLADATVFVDETSKDIFTVEITKVQIST